MAKLKITEPEDAISHDIMITKTLSQLHDERWELFTKKELCVLNLCLCLDLGNKTDLTGDTKLNLINQITCEIERRNK